MIDLIDFRRGQPGVPFACADELPACCFDCIYLQYEESLVCFGDAPFYYYCRYKWPDKLQQAVSPCLQKSQ